MYMYMAPFIKGKERRLRFSKFSKKGGGSDFSHKKGEVGKIGTVSLIVPTNPLQCLVLSF